MPAEAVSSNAINDSMQEVLRPAIFEGSNDSLPPLAADICKHIWLQTKTNKSKSYLLIHITLNVGRLPSLIDFQSTVSARSRRLLLCSSSIHELHPFDNQLPYPSSMASDVGSATPSDIQFTVKVHFWRMSKTKKTESFSVPLHQLHQL